MIPIGVGVVEDENGGYMLGSVDQDIVMEGKVLIHPSVSGLT